MHPDAVTCSTQVAEEARTRSRGGIRGSLWGLLLIPLLFWVIASSACSRVVEEEYYLDVLASLLDMPPMPFPPRTIQNRDSLGFLMTESFCYQMAQQRWRFEDWIRRMALEAGPPRHDGSDLEWELPAPDGVSRFILRVAPTDSLVFEMHWEGPAYDTLQVQDTFGYILPGIEGTIRKGVPWNALNSSLLAHWRPMDSGLRFDTHSETYPKFVYIGGDSTLGGGLITVLHEVTQSPVFLAQWDTLGHGSYWWYGSGGGGW